MTMFSCHHQTFHGMTKLFVAIPNEQLQSSGGHIAVVPYHTCKGHVFYCQVASCVALRWVRRWARTCQRGGSKGMFECVFKGELGVDCFRC